jgi:hypothetical protein
VVLYTRGVPTAAPLASPDVRDEDVIGAREIAERLDVKPGTVHMWRQREKDLKVPMPEPRGWVSGYPWWSWPEVKRWAKETGRLPEEET